MEDIRGIGVLNENEIEKVTEYEEEMTEKEKQEEILENEEEVLAGLFAALDYVDNDDNELEIVVERKGVKYFKFKIKPLTEKDYQDLRKKHTKYVRNKNTGIKVASEVDSVRYRSELLYRATIPADRKRIWEDKTAMNRANVITPIDMVDKLLLAGEKDAILDQLDRLSGYEDDHLEEIVKN